MTERCRCGSGEHPRECALHPEAYRFHVARLNLHAYLEEDEGAAAAELEYERAFAAWRDALKVRERAAERERCARIALSVIHDGHSPGQRFIGRKIAKLIREGQR